MDVLSDRIKSNTSHIRGAVQVSGPGGRGSATSSQMTWKFTDDQGRGWVGSALAVRSTEDTDKFNLTLQLARSS